MSFIEGPGAVELPPITIQAAGLSGLNPGRHPHTQAGICDQIQRLRGNDSPGTASAVPADQRATDSSLRARLTAP